MKMKARAAGQDAIWVKCDPAGQPLGMTALSLSDSAQSMGDLAQQRSTLIVHKFGGMFLSTDQ